VIDRTIPTFTIDNRTGRQLPIHDAVTPATTIGTVGNGVTKGLTMPAVDEKG